MNPQYEGTFLFDNDFPALLKDGPSPRKSVCRTLICKSCCVMLPRSSCLLLSFICCFLLSPQVLLFVAFSLNPLVFALSLSSVFRCSFPMLFFAFSKTPVALSLSCLLFILYFLSFDALFLLKSYCMLLSI